MRFGRAEGLGLAKVGEDHKAWQQKLALEQKSTLVSIERSVRDGLVEKKKVDDMLQTKDWMPTSSFPKQKLTFSPPQNSAKPSAEATIFERFPRLFSDCPVRGYRRGYYAPWAQSHFELQQHITPTDNKSKRQLRLEKLNNLSVRKQQQRARELSEERIATDRSEKHRGNVVRRKHNSIGAEIYPQLGDHKQHSAKLPVIKGNFR